MTGQTLAQFRILEKTAEGGMGVVYRALDTRLGRTVAIKVLHPETLGDPERTQRFIQEARTASALNHPNIVTIYDIAREGDVDFIAMEYIEGQSLDRLTGGQAMPVDRVLEYGFQLASALGAAHASGVVHRDVKPANVMVNHAGQVKVLDFGLAKLAERQPPGDETKSAYLPVHTREGLIVGTVAYMSPEQAEARPVDSRSDVFSLGAVLYELLTGRRPFAGDSTLATLAAIMRDPPAPLQELRPDVPTELARIVTRCLEKDRLARYRSGEEVADDLRQCRETLAGTGVAVRGRRSTVALVMSGAAIVAAAGIVWWVLGGPGRDRTGRPAVSEVATLIEQERHADALRVARKAGLHLTEDPQTRQLLRSISLTANIRTEPDGAEVYIKDYLAVNQEWELLGRSPLLGVLLPLGQLRWRVVKPGWETSEGAGFVLEEQQFVLESAGAPPAGMVRVPRGPFRFGGTMVLDDYWIDRHEVTNREFKRFVDASGYAQPTHWKHPFVKDGRTLSWEAAMREFRDATGRPGPATWQLGSYPDGQQDLPVGGVSWYEAAAFADFAGRSLPTVYHWYRAAQGAGNFSEILQLSNFGGQGPAKAGQYQGLAPFGTFDMAGNLAEWCWNLTGDRRFVVGGSWSDATYMFERENAQPPFARPATYGFRTASYLSPPAPAQTGPVERLGRDFTREKPADDRVFGVFQGLYRYADTPLNARVEAVDEAEHWRRERVAFDAAYGGERVIAYLFLPRGTLPPYQVVTYFPTSVSLVANSIDSAEMLYVDFLVRSGRAVMYPVYKGTYDRRVKNPSLSGIALERDLVIPWAKDLGRSLDYLQTRDDIDRNRVAFYGFSLGARYGPLLTAVEPRLKVSVLLAGGFSREELAPEVDPFNFAPRAKQPVLMLNGRDDFMRPVETSQLPLFRQLGAPDKDKRHVLFDAGHAPPRLAAMKEILEWLDRYLGPPVRDPISGK